MTNYTAINQNWSSLQDLSGILVMANNASGGWFWTAINWLIFIVLTLSIMSFGFETSLLIAGFVSLIVGIFLTYMGLTSFTNTLIYLGVILLSIIWIIWGSNRDGV